MAPMTALQASVLGLVQGLGEFLPISSSAHLVLVPRFLGWDDQGLSVDVALHLGTLLAVTVYFWKDLSGIALGALRGEPRQRKMLFLLAAATVPGGIAGLLLDDYVETVFRSPALIAWTLMLFGLLLGWADRKGRKERGLEGMDWGPALGVGLAQALAVVPGVSRSGITLTAALLLGFKREDAARFSFLLSFPIIAAAGTLKLRHLEPAMLDGAFLLGIAVAALSGAAAIWGLLNWVKTRSLAPFVVYRLLLGILLLFA